MPVIMAGWVVVSLSVFSGVPLPITTSWRLPLVPSMMVMVFCSPAAVCFVARWEQRPVAFSAWLPFVGPGRPARREHRTVTLPDFQGVGIGHALSGLAASLWRGLGCRALSTTTHPALIAARRRSPFLVLRRAPSLASGHERHGQQQGPH